jgi:hypothetical protein
MHKKDSVPAQAPQGNDPIRDLAEQARRLSISRSLLSKEIREGRMRAAAAGFGSKRRKWLIRDSWADSWLESRIQGGK